MDQGEKQEYKALEETHVGSKLGPLPDHLESAFLQDVLAAGSRGGGEQFGHGPGNQHACSEARQGGCEEEEEAELPRSDVSLVKRRARRAAASRRSPRLERPTICSECGKGRGFSGSSNLVKHSRVHTGERPHGCSQCGESFRLQPQLVRHQERHAE